MAPHTPFTEAIAVPVVLCKWHTGSQAHAHYLYFILHPYDVIRIYNLEFHTTTVGMC
ncbi:hypothetical protein CDL15_Pgr022700 [Punica granatum]|uniref:Uncharacterized protein n=1 Tax=Punica granatum TaxID=22663 RepID=A0A218XS07_PUNGR|nr:hypothetical protein CDL15_Pgr022700 [Punica granatum]